MHGKGIITYIKPKWTEYHWNQVKKELATQMYLGNTKFGVEREYKGLRENGKKHGFG